MNNCAQGDGPSHGGATGGEGCGDDDAVGDVVQGVAEQGGGHGGRVLRKVPWDGLFRGLLRLWSLFRVPREGGTRLCDHRATAFLVGAAGGTHGLLLRVARPHCTAHLEFDVGVRFHARMVHVGSSMVLEDHGEDDGAYHGDACDEGVFDEVERFGKHEEAGEREDAATCEGLCQVLVFEEEVSSGGCGEEAGGEDDQGGEKREFHCCVANECEAIYRASG